MTFFTLRPFCGFAEFEFKDPDTGRVHTGNSKVDLCARIRAYRQQNELPDLEFLETVVENYLCHRPKHAGLCQPLRRLKRGVVPTIKGGIALLQSMLYKSFAAKEVADERSAICAKCPHNFFPDKGPFIKWADKIAEASVGDRKSKHHDDLGNCEICTCPLRSKVHYAGKIELTEDELSKMPDYCWQKIEVLKNG